MEIPPFLLFLSSSVSHIPHTKKKRNVTENRHKCFLFGEQGQHINYKEATFNIFSSVAMIEHIINSETFMCINLRRKKQK